MAELQPSSLISASPSDELRAWHTTPNEFLSRAEIVTGLKNELVQARENRCGSLEAILSQMSPIRRVPSVLEIEAFYAARINSLALETLLNDADFVPHGIAKIKSEDLEIPARIVARQINECKKREI